mgnify:CR=1 FL=1
MTHSASRQQLSPHLHADQRVTFPSGNPRTVGVNHSAVAFSDEVTSVHRAEGDSRTVAHGLVVRTQQYRVPLPSEGVRTVAEGAAVALGHHVTSMGSLQRNRAAEADHRTIAVAVRVDQPEAFPRFAPRSLFVKPHHIEKKR